MKDPRRSIEQFCYKHPGFGIPNLMRYITAANVAIWVLGAINRSFLGVLTFDPALILHGQIWRLVSFIFYPPSMGLLAFLAFWFYYWIGSTLEAQWGTGQFTIYYFSGVILTVLYGFIIYFITGRSVNLGSEYIYLSMFFSFAVLYPDMQVLFMYIIPKDKVPRHRGRGVLCLLGHCQLLPGEPAAARRACELLHLLRW